MRADGDRRRQQVADNQRSDPDGDARLAAWRQRYGYSISPAAGYINVPNIRPEHIDAFNRENEEYRKAHWRQRNETRGQMGAMHRERQAIQTDAQQNLGVLLGSNESLYTMTDPRNVKGFLERWAAGKIDPGGEEAAAEAS